MQQNLQRRQQILCENGRGYANHFRCLMRASCVEFHETDTNTDIRDVPIV